MECQPHKVSSEENKAHDNSQLEFVSKHQHPPGSKVGKGRKSAENCSFGFLVQLEIRKSKLYVSPRHSSSSFMSLLLVKVVKRGLLHFIF